MSNEIKLVLEDGTFENDFIDSGADVLIYLNDILIGDIVVFAGCEDMHIELITLKENYRGKGYGEIALTQLKEIAKSLGIRNINGECRNSLINFYKRLGADFTPRTEYDLTYINNRFYIDL